jgi:hypothetical protein
MVHAIELQWLLARAHIYQLNGATFQLQFHEETQDIPPY